MTMPEIEINIEVYCARCGSGLCQNTTAVKTHNRGEDPFRVDPCDDCLKAEYDTGYEAGYDDASWHL